MPDRATIKSGDLVRAKWYDETRWYVGRVVLRGGALCIKTAHYFPIPTPIMINDYSGLAVLDLADEVKKLA